MRGTVSDAEKAQDRASDSSAETLLAAVDAAVAARDPQVLAEELAHVVRWMSESGSSCVDDTYARWFEIRRVFQDLDLTIWEERPTHVEEIATVLTEVNYYRELDLAVEERLALMVRARRLLSVRHYLGLARIDIERAELLSRRSGEDDLDAALTLCDDALASAEQLENASVTAHALFARSMVLLCQKRFAEAIAGFEKTRVHYEQQGVWVRVAGSYRLEAAANIEWDRMANAVPLLRQALEISERVKDSVGIANTLLLRAVTWKARGSAPKALDDCSNAVGRFERARMRTRQGRAMLQRAGYLVDVARYEEAQHDLEEALRYLGESPEIDLFVVAVVRLADVLRRRSAVDAAAARLDQAEAAMDRISRPQVRLDMLLRVAWVARELPVPDKPRLRRCCTVAADLARELGDEIRGNSARQYLAYAGP